MAAVLLTTGGGPSILARAYAGTSTNGVVVHYLERFRGQQGTAVTTSETQVWISGRRRHLIVTPERGPIEEVTFKGSREQVWHTNGTLYTFASPDGAAANQCSSSPTVQLDCVVTQPLAALRRLYRAGRLHADGQRNVDGRSADLITGAGPGVELRALVDPHTFIPIQMQLIQRSRPPGPVPSILTTVTITGYQRLSITTHNRQLLLMRSHPHARLVHTCVNDTPCTESQTR